MTTAATVRSPVILYHSVTCTPMECDPSCDIGDPRLRGGPRTRSSDGGARRRPWFVIYRARMDAGLEHCRRCGASERLTFDHIIPRSEGGSLRFDNVTVACAPCNSSRGSARWDIPSLAEEEAERPVLLRWSRMPVRSLAPGPNG